MRIKDVVVCIVSVLLIIGGILMYRVATSTQILESPVIIGKLYIWGYRILAPAGIVGFILSVFNIKRNKVEDKKENTNEETKNDNND